MRHFVPLLVLVAAGCKDAPAPPPVVSSLTELPATGWGTVRGRVTFDGEVPARAPLDTGNNPHRDHCQSADLIDETWIVDPKTKGVANVVVWLEAPEGTFFPRQPADRKTWPDAVVIDQPKCMFEPHVAVLFPEMFEPTRNRLVPTGQTLKVRNSSAVPHQAGFAGGVKNPPSGQIVPGKAPDGAAPEAVMTLKPDKGPIAMTCNLHRWMRGTVWAFDHPYATVSKADGSFELKNVPAGAKVRFRAWHEAGDVAVPAESESLTVPADGTIDVELKAKKKG